MDLLLEGASLIMIDVQQAFDDPRWGMRNNPAAESNIARLLATWRRSGQPLFHVQHGSLDANSPLHRSAPGYAFKPQAQPLPDEVLVHKNVNSAFIGTTLEQQLRDATASTLVIAGLTTDHCVSTTTRMAANLGFTVYLVGDACATFGRTGPNGARYTAAQMHDTALASLHGEFATVISSAEAVDQVG